MQPFVRERQYCCIGRPTSGVVIAEHDSGREHGAPLADVTINIGTSAYLPSLYAPGPMADIKLIDRDCITLEVMARLRTADESYPCERDFA